MQREEFVPGVRVWTARDRGSARELLSGEVVASEAGPLIVTADVPKGTIELRAVPVARLPPVDLSRWFRTRKEAVAARVAGVEAAAESEKTAWLKLLGDTGPAEPEGAGDGA